jgi:hypothetical protein
MRERRSQGGEGKDELPGRVSSSLNINHARVQQARRSLSRQIALVCRPCCVRAQQHLGCLLHASESW